MATIDLYAEHRVLTSDSCKDQCQGCTYLVGGGMLPLKHQCLESVVF